MYTHYFSLNQSPFSIAPDPRYLFMSERHREALAHLLYGIGSGGGFVLLTGEIGAGKTTVCRCFIEQVPVDCKLAYIFNPKLTVEELLLSVCDEFSIVLAPHGAGPVSVKAYVDAINAYLLASHAQGKNNVLIIDEAQNLSADVLEQLRLLTNLETNERKLLQIILIGQPELRTMLARPELEQLAQRVIARYHLGPLSEPETASYVAHRLTVAGATAATPFGRRQLALVHRLSKGVPRRINLLCDRALLGAYVENSREVTRPILRRAAAEVFTDAATPARRWPLLAAGVFTAAVVSGAAAWQLMPRASAPVVVKAAPVVKAAALAPAVHVNADSALRELAGIWDVALPEGDPCPAAQKLNLRCHQGKGSLYELRQLDRPAMLVLHDGPKVGYGVLVLLEDNSATLVLNGKRQMVSLAVLARQFDGEYTTLWKVPAGFRVDIGTGDKGPDVDWLAANLAQAQGQPAPFANQPFGKDMQEALRTFQAKYNLKADGLAGPRTFMRLNQLGGVAEPRLLATP